MGVGGDLEREQGALKRSGNVLVGGVGCLEGALVSGAGPGFQREARAAVKALEPRVGGMGSWPGEGQGVASPRASQTGWNLHHLYEWDLRGGSLIPDRDSGEGLSGAGHHPQGL